MLIFFYFNFPLFLLFIYFSQCFSISINLYPKAEESYAQNGGEIGLENAIWVDDVLHVIDSPLFVEGKPGERGRRGGKRGEGYFFVLVIGFMFVFS